MSKPRTTLVRRNTRRSTKKEDVPQISLEEEYDRARTGGPEMLEKFKTKMEEANAAALRTASDRGFLYPSLDDPNFNIKIAERKEFNDTRYEGKVKDVESEADHLCSADFELAPHQLFVRNFLSFMTPYNSLLLYHGLGSGKTCSAIGVGEEMRAYIKQIGINQRIIVVASPNVQENFKLQLFDDRKLKLVDGLWNIKTCTGNRLLKEINPMSMRGLSKEKVVRQVRRVINNSYLFLGYIEFANYVAKIGDVRGVEGDGKEIRTRRLQRYFNNRLIIIDEVHNIRITDENKDKKVAVELLKLVETVKGLRLLLLSATPMYNSYKEIIWLINLMNINDRRAGIESRQVFDKNGNFLVAADGTEVGRDLLERKAIGYVSFVRGENPYAFPYRIFPKLFAPVKSVLGLAYPSRQLNDKAIAHGLKHIDVFGVDIGEYQKQGYRYIMNAIRKGVRDGVPPYKEMPNFDNMDSFGYTMLQRPLEALNIVYPNEKLSTDDEEGALDPKMLVGKAGLTHTFKYQETGGVKRDFEYKKKGFGRILAPNNIGKYSSKIHNIVRSAITAHGIILIYSQYIDGGLIPIALALEELGYTRYIGSGGKSRSLFKTAPTEPIDYKTFQPRDGYSGDAPFRPARYVMITGDKSISPNNIEEVRAATSDTNVDGSQVKIVLISQAGSEGLDFIGIRQVHVLEPWYNMNRIEQIIGRAVRWCSHKLLPFTKRNVEIYLYGTRLNDELESEEAADLYIYRTAEMKAIQIGRVARVLKETAVDCLLNLEQTNFTIGNVNQTVRQELASGTEIEYQVGDRPYSVACDYMETCSYSCKPDANIDERAVVLDTFNEGFIMMNTDKIVQRIRQLMRERFFYDKMQLISHINSVRRYPLVQIDAALTQLVDDKNEYITDMYGRLGNLVNKGDLYLFQPLELMDTDASMFERRVPLQFKNEIVQIAPRSSDRTEVFDGKLTAKGDLQESKELLETMETDFLTTQSPKEPSRGEEDWYVFASNVVPDMIEEGMGDKDLLDDLVVAHIIEMLPYEKTHQLINEVYGGDGGMNAIAPSIAPLVKRYFDTRLMTAKGITGILVYKQGVAELLVKDANGRYRPGEGEDYADLEGKVNEKKITIDDLNNIVGFIAGFKNEYMVFKTKQMDKKRHKGARCDQSGKSESLRVLNLITASMGGREYTLDNTRDTNQRGICVRQELTLRVFESQRRENKTWFLSPSVGALIGIEKLSKTA